MVQSNSAPIFWEGDSLRVLRSFPKAIKEQIGSELRRLQLGLIPNNSRPLKSVGRKVFELKEQDSRAWYRVVYVARIHDRIYVLHCFKKKSRKTSKKDLSIISERLRFLLENQERSK